MLASMGLLGGPSEMIVRQCVDHSTRYEYDRLWSGYQATFREREPQLM